MKKISFIFGTRPEAIKMSPLVLAFQQSDLFQEDVCVTAQHREMLDQVLEIFEIKPNTDLNLMRPNQSLAALSSRLIDSLDQYYTKEKPDFVIVQGDTTTTFCAALTAFYHQIPIGHVEAGLRTGNMLSPWPEEGNRVLSSRLAALHFAPTERNYQNLMDEKVPRAKVSITGNTVIDALFYVQEKVRQHPPEIPGLKAGLFEDLEQRIVLITGHRRENFGEGFESICYAIKELALRFPKVQFVYPVHLNPHVQKPVSRILGQGDNALENVHLIEPLSYLPFVACMERATLILTDSGGVQEEAPSLGKPVIVMRDTTERPEAVDAGTVKLVGTSKKKIVDAVSILLSDDSEYQKMARSHNPYGNGDASQKILEQVKAFFQL